MGQQPAVARVHPVLHAPLGPKPNRKPMVGVPMQIQFWYRDPQNTSNQTTSLSNALEVDICP